MQRMLGGKCVGRMVDHVLGFVADGQHAMRAFLDSHNGRLVDHNALARDGDQGIRGAKVNGHVTRHLASEPREKIQE